MRRWTFAKGHGTGNDFVILLDRNGMVDPDPDGVRFLCDRHRGIGGDGVLRVVPGRYVADWDGDDDVWFMDYRNADGSVAQMCGNGARVFARYLLDRDLAQGPELVIGTRSGPKTVMVHADGRITVAMGQVRLPDGEVEVTVHGSSQPLVGQPADVGNPHVVAQVADLAALTELDLWRTPGWPAERFPDGVNVELITRVDERRLAMRVHERGVGETQSCGTGTVAAAAVASRWWADTGGVPGDPAAAQTWQVDVPGGRVEVTLSGVDADGAREAQLTGPAVIVAHGEVLVPHAPKTDA